MGLMLSVLTFNQCMLTSKALLTLMIELKFHVLFAKVSIILEIQDNYKKCASLIPYHSKSDRVSYGCHNTNAEEKLTVNAIFIPVEGIAVSFKSRPVNREHCRQKRLGIDLGIIQNHATSR